MQRRAVLMMAGAAVALAAIPQRVPAQTVSACTGNNCAQVGIAPASINAAPNGVATIGVTFKQGANDGQNGGADEIAALALTLSLSPNAAVPLLLNNCTLNADGLPAAVKPDPSIANFKVVVENASCINGRTHCLCPGSGMTQDNFINLVIYGPNPLPTPGPNPVDIPVLPAGPQQLLTIDLKVAASATGTIPLHLYNQVEDSQHPAFSAFLSAGDKQAVDVTCVPVAGQPPCSGSATSQVKTTDGSVLVAGGTVCAGDCDGGKTVTVNEIIVLVNIALENGGTCANGVPAGKNVDITLIIQAVNNALNDSCPM